MYFLSVLLSCVANASHPSLPPPRHGGVYVVAHRGAHDGTPENTVPAYARAIELGCDFVEIDVRATKDGHLVCIHNDKVDDYAPGAHGRVKEYTLAALRALDVGSRIGPQWKDTRIPTFEEALDCCKGKIGVYLDVKDAALEQLVPLVKARAMERHVLWYIGVGAVPRLRALCPECISMPDPHTLQGLPRLLDSVKPGVVAAVWDAFSAEFVEKCHRAGAIVIVDEDGPGSWVRAIEWGADGIQTDQPAALIRQLDAGTLRRNR